MNNSTTNNEFAVNTKIFYDTWAFKGKDGEMITGSQPHKIYTVFYKDDAIKTAKYQDIETDKVVMIVQDETGKVLEIYIANNEKSIKTKWCYNRIKSGEWKLTTIHTSK